MLLDDDDDDDDTVAPPAPPLPPEPSLLQAPAAITAAPKPNHITCHLRANISHSFVGAPAIDQ
ncbi:Hypothetical protein A7982_06003 [Minicystis rosea]|nr:Hypothetical protein A7982_06003 [Minicystis rosea]